MKTPIRFHPLVARRGFALVVTLSMMILLVVIAVGLLTLSSVSLRSTSRSNLLGQAKANARMAMMIAIGEVQKTLGPDRSAAGPAAMVLNKPAEPHVSGVWETWTWDPTTRDSAPDYTTEKKSKFRGWLMSDSEEPGRRMDPDFPATEPANPVRLVGTGSATHPGPDSTEVHGGVVTVDTGQKGQGYSWVALQEDVKAHLQPGTGPEPTTQEGLLAASFAPDESGMHALDFAGTMVDDREARQKAFSTATIALAAENPATGRRSFHDLSPWPKGVLADAALGGLRRDLTTEFENFTNSPLKGERLYDAGTGAEPWWDALADYYNLAERVKSSAGGGATALNIDSDLKRFSEINGTNSAPLRTVLTPVIAKVDIVFSMVTHDLQGAYATNYKSWDPKFQHYSPYLSFEPVITLWNPYNVPLSFSEMKVFFDKIPVGFRFAKREGNGPWYDVRNAKDETEYWWPLSRYISGGNKNNAITNFFVRLQGGDSNGSPGGTITLDPGEARVFTAWVGKNQTWGQIKDQFTIEDRNSVSKTIQASGSGVKFAGGLMRTGGFTFQHLARYQDKRNPDSLYAFEKTKNNRNDWHKVVLRADDGFRVKARLLDNDAPDNDPSADNDRNRSFEMKVSLMSKNARNMNDASNVVQDMEVSVNDFFKLYHVGDPKIITHDVIADQVYQGDSEKGPGAKSAFAVLSLTAKPTRDLLHPTKGWLFGNPVTAGVRVDESLAPYSAQSHEISFLEIFGANGFPMVDVDVATGTRGFFGPGQTSEYGLTAATMFALPREPMTSIGQFHAANVLASAALPHFNYPVGNSHAHPLIPADRVKQGSMLDHSFALNWRLWDSFYFSSLSKDATVDAAAFAAGEVPANSRLEYHQGNAPTVADAVEEMTAGTDDKRSQRVASHQLLRGAFNVNSTSVDAWTAVLSGLRDRAILTRDGGERDSDLKSPYARLITAQTSADETAAIGGGAGNGGTEADRAKRWVGIHLLDDSQIVALATEIVNQIKLRGREDEAPILTLGEFVNRRPGSAGDIHSEKGLLQTAIEEANTSAALYSLDDGDPIVPTAPVPNNQAMVGNTAEGSPADLLQGDILQSIGSFLTTHPDTLRIRTYGRAGEGIDRAEAWCEAIIQRVPEYIDPALAPEAIPVAGSVNERFGRRYEIISFRWLSQNEI